MLYTTYLSKMKDIPKDVLTVVIMRMPPAFIYKDNKIMHVPQLSPNLETLKKYKADNDFEIFTEAFKKQMYEDKETIEYLNMLFEALEKIDIAIVCCEKDRNVCHRSLIADYAKDLGIEFKEL